MAILLRRTPFAFLTKIRKQLPRDRKGQSQAAVKKARSILNTKISCLASILTGELPAFLP
jgi:hypothetical protein